MVREASSIGLFFLRLILVLLNKAECKSGGGHYSSQRTLGSSPPAGGHGMMGGNQLQNPMHWSNSWLPSDINAWYDYGMSNIYLFRNNFLLKINLVFFN
jgi:hypothetical protein